MHRKLRYTALGLIVLASAGLLGYRIQQVVVKQNNLVQSAPVQTVQVQDVGFVKKENSLDLYGNIDAINKVSVSSKIAGRVSRVAVENGQPVTSGEPLVFLEDQDYRNLLSTSQDTLKKAQLKLNDAQADYDRARKLLDAGAIARNNVDKAKLAVDVAQADVNSALTAVDNARQSVDNTVVSAPFAGVVVSRTVSTGLMISPGVPLLTLADVSSVYAVVNVKQDDLPQINQGMPAQVLLSNNDKHPLPGVVTLISPAANQAARAFEVRIKVDNQAGLLKPGMFIKVRLNMSSPVDVLTVPQYALSGKEGAYYVYVADGNHARQRTVETGATFGNMIGIQAGLKPGDKVIVTNINKLKDDDLINVVGQ